MFTPDDQAQIIALVAPLMEHTLTDAVAVAAQSTAVPTWRPGTCTSIAGTVATLVTDEPGATPIQAGVIGTLPVAGARVMAVFVPGGAVFCFAMSSPDDLSGYVSTIGGWVLNNAVFEAQYQRTATRAVHYRGSIVVGSGTTFGAALNLRCPVAVDTEQWFFGGCLIDNSGGVFTPCVWRITVPNTVTPYAMAGTNGMNNAGLTSTIPWTWAVNDQVHWSFDYVPAA